MSRKQKGQLIETDRSWFLRYYTPVEENGQTKKKQTCIRLCDKSDLYRFKSDVRPLADQYMSAINAEQKPVTGATLLSDYVNNVYLPWVKGTDDKPNKAAATYAGYRQLWKRYLEPRFGKLSLLDVKTPHVTKLLTDYAKEGLGARTLSHIKWMLSGVYVYAIGGGVIPDNHNPAFKAEWQAKAKKPEPKIEYSIQQVLQMISVLEPIDLRATTAIAVCYFTSARPSECRGLRWEDIREHELDFKRSIWRNHVGETKTEDSAATVPVVEPLKTLLAKLRAHYGNPLTGYVFQNAVGKSLSLDSLNTRVITPALKKAGIVWEGYYPCRRGISSLVTDLSKNPLNSTGLLRHSTPITALQHYTRPQADSVRAALNQVQDLAQSISKSETVQ
jgi:integrase